MKKENFYVAIKIALVVGTLLNIINNWDINLFNTIDKKKCFQIMLTYMVPFFVSIYSQKKANDQK